MIWITNGILIILLIILYIKYKEKKIIDDHQKQELDLTISFLNQRREQLQNEINELTKETDLAIERYNNSVRDKSEELENYFDAQKRRRQQILDEDLQQREEKLNQIFEAQKNEYNNQLEKIKHDCEERANIIGNATEDIIKELQEKVTKQEADTEYSRKRYESLLAPIKQYEMEKQQRLFYTIQLPEEFRDDIDFLLTTVSSKVQHPDIISKLIWAEYVKPYLDETFKRLEIKDQPGIYKLTNINDQKGYIGKSTTVKKRISDHFKSAIGIRSIADQAVHHAILKTGFWNWSIEVIIYCEKDQLNDMEKYYINFFKTQEFGYNKTGGGEG